MLDAPTDAPPTPAADEPPWLVYGWHNADLPKRGWSCVDVEDLGGVDSHCEMCGTEIRYVHHMVHPDIGREYETGCICAGYMEGDDDAPRERERRLKNRAGRRCRWISRKWLTSRAGNFRLNVNGRTLGVYRDPFHPGAWKARVGDRFGRKQYATPDAAKLALFDYLYPPREAGRN
jgi:hypothetical protein